MRNTLKKTLITHLKKHLVMSKDFYTKAEVDKFNSGVDEIQESFSRVEAKINELLQNKSQ